MRAEESAHGRANPAEGIDDEHMGRSRGGIAHLAAIQGIILDFFEGICQLVGVAADFGTIMVGFILAGAGNRHLNQAGS